MADNWSNAIVGNYDPDILQKYKDLKKEDPRFGIVGALAKHFGVGYKIYSKNDVSQNLETPSFFIYGLIMNVRQIFGARESLDYNFDIHYYPKTDPIKTDLYTEFRNMELELYEALRQISILGYDSAAENEEDKFVTFILSGDETRSMVTDNVLHFFVHYKTYYFRPEIKAPEMETIEQNIKLKE